MSNSTIFGNTAGDGGYGGQGGSGSGAGHSGGAGGPGGDGGGAGGVDAFSGQMTLTADTVSEEASYLDPLMSGQGVAGS